FQHEFDHLNGVLILDRISPAKRPLLRKKLMDIARTVKR
ncbi:MAG TPA: peptide deformylase, partial [Thermotoga sp.]|nr:peptide deformylase [Thermotoga sp.]